MPPTGWGSLDGVQLVVRGCPGRQIQVRRARVDGWSPAVERRFLGVLAATCNVKGACAEIRMTQSSAYGHRKQWSAFAKLWDDAIAEGYARLEIGLLENANNLFSQAEVPPATDMPPMYASEAIHLLYMHRQAVLGIGGRQGPGVPRKATEDELADALHKALTAFERGKAVSARRRARDKAEWAGRRGSG